MSQDENIQNIKKGAVEMIQKFQKDLETAENDKTGTSLLNLFSEYLGLPENNLTERSQEEIKENTEQKSVLGSLKDSASQIAEFTSEFVKNLKKAEISKELKKEIAEVCKDFKELLKNTTLNLQKYRLDVEDMEESISDVVEVLIPPEYIFKKLKELNDEDARKTLEGYRYEQRDDLKNALETLAEQMKKGSSLVISEEGEKWKELADKINKTVEKITKEISVKQKKFRRTMLAIGIIAGIIATTAVIITTCGLAAPLAVPLGAALSVTTKTAVGIVVGVAAGISVVACGAAIFACDRHYPQIYNMLNNSRVKTIKAISEGLHRISEQSDVMDTVLFDIHNQWRESIRHRDSKSYQQFKRNIKKKGLLKKLHQTATKLSELKTSIKETEDVCKEELIDYNKNIYKPLLQLYKL